MEERSSVHFLSAAVCTLRPALAVRCKIDLSVNAAGEVRLLGLVLLTVEMFVHRTAMTALSHETHLFFSIYVILYIQIQNDKTDAIIAS